MVTPVCTDVPVAVNSRAHFRVYSQMHLETFSHFVVEAGLPVPEPEHLRRDTVSFKFFKNRPGFLKFHMILCLLFP